MATSKAEHRDPAVEALPITLTIGVLWLLAHRALAEVVHYLDGLIGGPIAGPFA